MPATHFYTLLTEGFDTTESWSRVSKTEIADLAELANERGEAWQVLECDVAENRCGDITEEIEGWISEAHAEARQDPYAGCRLTVAEAL